MINELYAPIKGTPHVVKVVNVLREMTKGENIENTAITQQVLLQRQKFYIIDRMGVGKETLHEDDLNFEPFSMALELFLEEYEKFVEVDPELFIRTNGKCEEDRLCGAEELKTIKEVLQDFQGTYPKQYDPINPTHYQIGGIETIDYIEAKLTPEEFKGYCKGNSIKYISRAGYKGKERDDYKKAAWYLDRLLEIAQKGANNAN